MGPDFLYIGASKAGSSWFQKFCENHCEIFVPASKDSYFFNAHYHRGWGWYEKHFRSKKDETVSGEICHDYFVDKVAMQRIADDLPEVQLILSLRNPFERAVSSYKYLRRNGYDGCFQKAIKDYPIIVQEGCYGSIINHLYKLFNRKQIKIFYFEDIHLHPKQTMCFFCDFIGVAYDETSIPGEKINPAAAPRWRLLAYILWSFGRGLRKTGFGGFVGMVKSNSVLRKLLFRQLPEEESFEINHAIEFPEEMIRQYNDEIDKLCQLGFDRAARWKRISLNCFDLS